MDEYACERHDRQIDKSVVVLYNVIDYLISTKKNYCYSRQMSIDQSRIIVCVECKESEPEEQAMYCDSGHHVCHACLFYCGSFYPMETCRVRRCKRRLCINCKVKSKYCSKH